MNVDERVRLQGDRTQPDDRGPRSRSSMRRIRMLVAALITAAVSQVDTAWAEGDFVASDRRERATIWAVGDGADGSADAIAVAELIERGDPDRFLYLGDVYERGTAEEFATNYAPVYGRFDSIAAPTPGNHEWGNRETGYYPYWARAKGQEVPDWYAFRVAGWQFLSLNSEAEHTPGSPQLRWLRRRLRRTPGAGTCRIAFWHRPRYSAGVNGDQEDTEPFWDKLTGRARVVVNGHDHDMQRHVPRRGIVELIAGSGGHELQSVDEEDPRLAFGADQTAGALRLRLRRREARFAFVSAQGHVLDAGRIPCRRGS